MKKLLILILLAVSISSNITVAQTATIPPKCSWVNMDTVTYYAVDRPRMERMLLKAEMFDTTFALLVREDLLNQELRQSRSNWRTTAITMGGFFIAIVIWEAVH